LDILICLTFLTISSILFLYLLKYDNKRSLIFTPFFLIMLYELIIIFPAFIYSYLTKISDHYPLLVFFSGFMAIIVGWLFTSGYLKSKGGAAVHFAKKQTNLEYNTDILIVIITGTLLLSISGLYRFQGFPSVGQAIIGLILGEDYNQIISFVGESRKEITKGYIFGGEYRGQGIIKVFSQYGWPYFTGIAIIMYLKTRRMMWSITSFIMLILSFLFVAGEGTRGPFLQGILSLIVLYSFMMEVKIKQLMKLFFVIIGIIILTSILSPKLGTIIENDNFITEASERIARRIFIGNAINDVYAIVLLQNGAFEYRLGSIHMRDIKASFPGTGAGIPFAHELYLKVNPYAPSTRTTFMSGTYITKAYIDFGSPGVIVIYFIIGSTAAIWSRILIAVHKTPLKLAAVSGITYSMGTLVMGGGFISMAVSVMVIGFFYCFSTFVLGICIMINKSLHADIKQK